MTLAQSLGRRCYTPLYNLFLALFFSAVTLFALNVGHGEVHAKSNPRYASLVMDADTGVILYQRNADKKLHPASLTKIMTLVMLFEEIRMGHVRLNDRIRISKYAASMVPSKLGLAAGSSIRVQDAIYALVTKSANDIAVAIAEHIGGTERNFAKMMTQRARLMGMSNTRFVNASGLHDPQQISTARDMAKLAHAVIQTYPREYRYFSRRNFTYAGHHYRNHNRLMDKYPGMDGFKTGYVAASGFNLVASAVRNNRRLIGVVFGGRSAASRNAHMAKLLDNGFAKVNEIRIASAKMPLPPRKPAIVTALNTLANLAPAAGESSEEQVASSDYSFTLLQNSRFKGLIGEGDNDPAALKRIETGLIAMSAHKKKIYAGNHKAARTSQRVQPILASYSPYQEKSWAVQVGAYTSRASTDKALQKILKTLPRRYANVRPLIAPLKTREGWLFRGRLTGYSRDEAFAACKLISDCMPVAP